MVGELRFLFPRADVPDSHGVVPACRSQNATIRRKAQPGDKTAMLDGLAGQLFLGHIKNVDTSVFVSYGQQPSVRRISQRAGERGTNGMASVQRGSVSAGFEIPK